MAKTIHVEKNGKKIGIREGSTANKIMLTLRCFSEFMLATTLHDTLTKDRNCYFYPTLKRLKEVELIEENIVNNAPFYRLTDAGRELVSPPNGALCRRNVYR
jgi:hypothetical protein